MTIVNRRVCLRVNFPSHFSSCAMAILRLRVLLNQVCPSRGWLKVQCAVVTKTGDRIALFFEKERVVVEVLRAAQSWEARWRSLVVFL